MKYLVINISTGETWEGEAENGKEAYSHIVIKKGDTTRLLWGKNQINAQLESGNKTVP